jgi:hypothetical protein
MTIFLLRQAHQEARAHQAHQVRQEVQAHQVRQEVQAHQVRQEVQAHQAHLAALVVQEALSTQADIREVRQVPGDNP